MYHSRAVSLLEIVRQMRGVDIGITWLRCNDGERMWVIDARSGDGQFWRVQHAELLAAASILSDLLTSASVEAPNAS